MACHGGSASHTDSPRRREPGSGPGLQREWVLGSPAIRARPESHNNDRRLLASADLHFENLAGNHTRSRRSRGAMISCLAIGYSGWRGSIVSAKLECHLVREERRGHFAQESAAALTCAGGCDWECGIVRLSEQTKIGLSTDISRGYRARR